MNAPETINPVHQVLARSNEAMSVTSWPCICSAMPCARPSLLT